MIIELYKTSSEKNKIGKNLTNKIVLEGNLREQSNVISPSISIQVNNPTLYNYARIPEFNRYYYITEITSIRTGIWQISLSVDVLETYKAQIRGLKAVVDKQQGTNYSTELYDDGSFRYREDTFIETAKFQNGFSETGQYILLTAGAIAGGE
jgi:hypothetical protein